MTQSFMGDKQCWMEHMALNSTDGLDPEGIKLRASEGLLAVDYFFPGYAVWAGMIHAAADLGYDTNNLVEHRCHSERIESIRKTLDDQLACTGYAVRICDDSRATIDVSIKTKYSGHGMTLANGCACACSTARPTTGGCRCPTWRRGTHTSHA